MLDLVVVDSPQSLQSKDRVKISGRWDGEGKLSRKVGTKEGLLKRSRLGESAGGKLWERKRWEEPKGHGGCAWHVRTHERLWP